MSPAGPWVKGSTDHQLGHPAAIEQKTSDAERVIGGPVFSLADSRHVGNLRLEVGPL